MYFDIVVSKEGEVAFISDYQPEDMIKTVVVDHRTGLCVLEFQNKPNAEELDVNLCNDILIAMEKEKNAVFAYFDKVSNTFKDIYYINLLQSNIYERQASYD